jgi:outer membrane lipoprotein LolB
MTVSRIVERILSLIIRPWNQSRTVLLLLFGVIVLQACAWVERESVEQNFAAWGQRLARIEPMDQWAFRGRASISHEEEGWQIDIDWRQQHDRFELHMVGPLGQGAAELTGAGDRVLLNTSDGRHFEAATARELIRQKLGWDIPVADLGYWVRGVPAPGTHVVNQLDALGRVVKMEQEGWTIEFQRYDRVGDVELPAKFIAYNDSWRFKLVIDSWTL